MNHIIRCRAAYIKITPVDLDYYLYANTNATPLQTICIFSYNLWSSYHYFFLRRVDCALVYYAFWLVNNTHILRMCGFVTFLIEWIKFLLYIFMGWLWGINQMATYCVYVARGKTPLSAVFLYQYCTQFYRPLYPLLNFCVYFCSWIDGWIFGSFYVTHWWHVFTFFCVFYF